MIKEHSNQIMYETANAVTHGLAFVVSVILSIMLINKAIADELSTPAIVSLVIYSVTVGGLYLASTLFHCFVFTKAKRVFQILDHSNIFILIAGTYTPYCIVFLHNQAAYWLLTIIWGLSLAGIGFHILGHGRYQKIETTVYVVMGWLCLLLGKQLYIALAPVGFWLLVTGGVIFTVGAIIYSFKRISGLHLIWHFFVMGGTLAMFISIYLNI
ncbi:PAQR family membrane homeostasis protein TrhA [Lentilactobacillus kosonis]|uniref:Predicted membrane protein hemolysin III homolog n=1 Tax=Lentilactobacillus kosonis TaxID=2810561 RepID=A0A401FNM9_9LACO|nr:hemolysin III family protein [Lentilactobacillus kosonis]GAY73916.1 predicted membrane protein hemolysin III homolog [Lentilactobacillus kosonis]